MRRITVPVGALGAVFTAMIALAAPANAASVETTPLRTLSSGLCVGEVRPTLTTGREPGVLGIAVPPISRVVGIPPLSGACSFDLIVSWHNLDTGATGSHRHPETVGSGGCDVPICAAWGAATGPGRVAVEVTSDQPHMAGHAEIVVT